jgi:small-conductance mechanosensitive channel
MFMVKKTNDPHLDMIRNKFFRESFMGIAVFGVPAFAALFIGRYLDSLFFSTKKLFTLILLVSAFVISWVIILYRNKRVTREYREYRNLQKNTPDREEETNAETDLSTEGDLEVIKQNKE